MMKFETRVVQMQSGNFYVQHCEGWFAEWRFVSENSGEKELPFAYTDGLRYPPTEFYRTGDRAKEVMAGYRIWREFQKTSLLVKTIH